MTDLELNRSEEQTIANAEQWFTSLRTALRQGFKQQESVSPLQLATVSAAFHLKKTAEKAETAKPAGGRLHTLHQTAEQLRDYEPSYRLEYLPYTNEPRAERTLDELTLDAPEQYIRGWQQTLSGIKPLNQFEKSEVLALYELAGQGELLLLDSALRANHAKLVFVGKDGTARITPELGNRELIRSWIGDNAAEEKQELLQQRVREIQRILPTVPRHSAEKSIFVDYLNHPEQYASIDGTRSERERVEQLTERLIRKNPYAEKDIEIELRLLKEFSGQYRGVSLAELAKAGLLTKTEGQRFHETEDPKRFSEELLNHLAQGKQICLKMDPARPAMNRYFRLGGDGVLTKAKVRTRELNHYGSLQPGKLEPIRNVDAELRMFVRELPDFLQEHFGIDVSDPADAERLKAFYPAEDGKSLAERNMLSPFVFSKEPDGTLSLISEPEDILKPCNFDLRKELAFLESEPPRQETAHQLYMLYEAAMSGRLMVRNEQGSFQKVFVTPEGRPSEKTIHHKDRPLQGFIREVLEKTDRDNLQRKLEWEETNNRQTQIEEETEPALGTGAIEQPDDIDDIERSAGEPDADPNRTDEPGRQPGQKEIQLKPWKAESSTAARYYLKNLSITRRQMRTVHSDRAVGVDQNTIRELSAAPGAGRMTGIEDVAWAVSICKRAISAPKGSKVPEQRSKIAELSRREYRAAIKSSRAQRAGTSSLYFPGVGPENMFKPYLPNEMSNLSYQTERDLRATASENGTQALRVQAKLCGEIIRGMQEMRHFVERGLKQLPDISMRELIKPEHRNILNAFAAMHGVRSVMKRIQMDGRILESLPAASDGRPIKEHWNEEYSKSNRLLNTLETVFRTVIPRNTAKDMVRERVKNAIVGSVLTSLLNEKALRHKNDKLALTPMILPASRKRIERMAEAQLSRPEVKTALAAISEGLHGTEKSAVYRRFEVLSKLGELSTAMQLETTMGRNGFPKEIRIDPEKLLRTMEDPAATIELQPAPVLREEVRELVDKPEQTNIQLDPQRPKAHAEQDEVQRKENQEKRAGRLQDVENKLKQRRLDDTSNIRGYQFSLSDMLTDADHKHLKSDLKEDNGLNNRKTERRLENQLENGRENSREATMEDKLLRHKNGTELLAVTEAIRDAENLQDIDRLLDNGLKGSDPRVQYADEQLRGLSSEEKREKIGADVKGSLTEAMDTLNNYLDQNLQDKELSMAEMTKKENQNLLKAGTVLGEMTSVLNSRGYGLSREERETIRRAENLSRTMELLTPKTGRGSRIADGNLTVQANSDQIAQVVQEAMQRASLQSVVEEKREAPENRGKQISELVNGGTLDKLEYLAWSATQDTSGVLSHRIEQLNGSRQQEFNRLANSDALGKALAVGVRLDGRGEPASLVYDVQQLDALLGPEPAPMQETPVLTRENGLSLYR